MELYRCSDVVATDLEEECSGRLLPKNECGRFFDLNVFVGAWEDGGVTMLDCEIAGEFLRQPEQHVGKALDRVARLPCAFANHIRSKDFRFRCMREQCAIGEFIRISASGSSAGLGEDGVLGGQLFPR